MSDFFEKMKEGFNRGVTAVSTGSKTVIEKTKITVAIKNLENEKSKLMEELGSYIYTYYSENDGGDIPCFEVAPLCKEIAMCDEQIKVNKKRQENFEEDKKA